MAADPAIDLVAEYIEAFRASTTFSEPRPNVYVVQCTDEASLCSALSDLHQSLQGRRKFDNPEYAARMAASGLTFPKLVAVPDKKPDGSDAHQVKIELGDVGESIGCLILLAYFGHEAQNLQPKNLLKTSMRVSEHGIDILIADMEDIELPDDRDIAPNDRLHLCESKAGGVDGSSFSELFGNAKRTNAGITLDRLDAELGLAEAKLTMRDGNSARSRRLKWFPLHRMAKDGTVHNHALLHNAELIDEDVLDAISTAHNKTSFSRTIMSRGKMAEIRKAVFQYRRVANAS